MTLRIIALIFFFSFYCCSDNTKNQIKKLGEKYNGVYLINSARQGRFYIDINGTKYAYTYITTTLTNDTIIPIDIQIEFLKEYYQNELKYKVFLLPEIMTVEKQKSLNFFNSEVCKFIDNGLNSPTKIHKIISPKKEYNINIGILYPYNIKDDYMGPDFSIFSMGHKRHLPVFLFPDSLLIQPKTIKNQIDLSLGLSFNPNTHDSLDVYSIIQCGQINFFDK